MMHSNSEVFRVPSGLNVTGHAMPPGSKSITQRYFNLALLGNLSLTIHRPLFSEDTRFFLGALETCGARVEYGRDQVKITPGQPLTDQEIFCGAGGTMFRFLTAALTAVPGNHRLDGIARLRERPIGPLVDALRQLGAQIDYLGEEGFPPLAIHGKTLEGGECTLDAGVSSQFLSAMLMATLAASRPSTIRVEKLTSAPYVDLTLDAIGELKGQVKRHAAGLYHVLPSELATREVTVEADYSSVAYPAAAAALCGGPLRISPLVADSRQGDRRFIDLLEAMGAQVLWLDGALEIRAGELRAVEADLSAMPDQVPTLAALAPFAAGTTRITNVPHLRLKESDRLAAMARELKRVGAEVDELSDGLVIPGIWHDKKPPTKEVEVETWGDHRIAMSMALVGLRRPGIALRHPDVVQKSYPNFWRDLTTWLEHEKGGDHEDDCGPGAHGGEPKSSQSR